jgi:hypothetical protein
MDEKIQHIPSAQLSNVSPVSDINQYVGLLSIAINLSSDIIEYNRVVKECEIITVQEETKRLEIITKSTEEMAELSRQLDMLEKDLLADIDRLKVFVEESMDAVQELIARGKYELADKFHERVSDKLEGRVSLVRNKLNQANSENSTFKIE